MGIAGLIVGAGGTAAGAALLAMGEKTSLKDGDPTMTDDQDFRRPGIGVLAGGVTVLIVGAALLTADRLKARRAKRVSVSPVVGPTVTGLSLSGRF